ncbi:MAG: hypothetical protein MUE85_18680 [Microscillaceae bacterium]|nr:hypothetical protein [Microscillaceae bacterium]
MILSDISNQDISFWADITSFIGFGVTIITLIISLLLRTEVKKLQDNNLIDKRLPEHIKTLEIFASELNKRMDDLNDEKNINYIEIELSKIISELVSLNKKRLDKTEKTSIRSLIKFIKQTNNKKIDFYRQIYRETQALIISLRNVLQDNQNRLRP